MTSEEYRDIKGFQGNVRSVDRWVGKNLKRFLKGQSMLLSTDKDGYLRIALKRNNKSYPKIVSRIVAETFIPNPESKPTVNHKDGVKTNNCVSNLEWATHSENQKHKFAIGLATQVSVKNNASKLTESSLKEIRARIGKDKDRYIALDFGVCEETVRKIRVGQTHKIKA